MEFVCTPLPWHSKPIMELFGWIASASNLPWMIAGDFNELVNNSEKCGGYPISHGSGLVEWIDRNQLIDLGFIGAQHLPRVKSDHCPLLISLQSSHLPCANVKPFRFQAMWLLHPTFRSFVVDKWAHYIGNILQKTKDLSKALADWNKDVFGCLFRNKKKLLARIGGIHKALYRRHSPFLVDLEKELDSDYQALLDQEELFWLQKSRNTWLKEGDRNTKFFHMSTIIRRRKNKLEGLTNEQAASIPDALNDTLITLVPEVASPSSVAQLKPISLCNTMYKVKVFSPAQASFIPGRQIVDNIIVSQEVLHKFRNSKGKKGFITWKIDLSKAYDRLHWDFIYDVLWEIGKLGLECIKSVRYQAILNGELTERFSPSAGIRQGDPLSPYIFVLCMEKLSHIINDHQVNFDKSRICCSPNTNSGIASTIANICGSPLTDCLGNYLGVPFIQSRITKDTYSGIVDKVQRRLASWKSHALSMAGRLTYLHAVTLAIPIYTMQTIDLPMSTDFLWGYTGEKTKIHLVNWDIVCQPKSFGGLGIKKTHCMNQALLAKTGWKIVQKDQDRSLLAAPNLKFLNCSSTWRGILFGSQIVSKGFKWRVGNGDKILFWKDNWAGFNHTEVDSCIWQLTSNGEFSVKTAYLSLFTEETNHTWNWDTIWKLHVPPKIKTFVWLLFQGKLLTNVQRVRRNLASNPNCPCCNVSMESLDHLFRRCSHATRMWNSIGIPNQIAHSFSMDFKDWLFINIKASFSCMQGITWSSLFLASLWFCWKWRCKKVFDVNFTPPHWPHIPIIQFTREWLVANCSKNSKTSKQILKFHWPPPCAGCFKINVDGSCMGEMGSISAGGIIRDSTGRWIKGFVTNLGCGKILEAELWGVFRGLLLTWNEGVRRIKVECDSFTAVFLINGETRPSHPLSNLIHSCKDMLLRDWECSISHIYREQNIAADHMAHMGQSSSLGYHVVDLLPPSIVSPLANDSVRMTTSRLFPV
ncbi:Polynucleotidyl transferase, ribonuclease H-like superfamily protein [Prunus dulcis]|uniref:Polynucleotidyl transferase, ribonuclease H-like superfamily protein n=1 Tax=Prunus dulcis TaxID=3755 RepID=A0A5H2XGQ0_PRUDU|nr:Polynucleotidyl transferase, ribonuclease H-like superfamily protein [Prunus dulcis]